VKALLRAVSTYQRVMRVAGLARAHLRLLVVLIYWCYPKYALVCFLLALPPRSF